MDEENDDLQNSATGIQIQRDGMAHLPFLEQEIQNESEATLAVLSCPICGENMISLRQLNRHIDDLHGPGSENLSEQIASDTPREFLHENGPSSTHLTPQKRSLKLDLHEDSSRFSLSENGSSAESIESKKLTRVHWKHMSQKGPQKCTSQACRNVLNVRNGVVNCRKCGDLFCNQHTRFQARLSNGPREPSSKFGLPVYDSKNGVMAKVCHDCYVAKPEVRLGTQVFSVDLTSEFKAMRIRKIEEQQLARGVLHGKFLKLADLHAQSFLYRLQSGKNLFLYLGTLSKATPYSKELLLEAEKDIVGVGNWEADENVSHCKICFAKFNILVRKHHCRLCGSVVDDGIFGQGGPANICSAQVPMGLLLDKLRMLNYSPVIKANWDTLVLADGLDAASAAGFSVRICKTCKDLLLHTSPVDVQRESQDDSDVLDAYDLILVRKSLIIASMSRYKELLEENKEAQNSRINKERVRLKRAVKDLEILVNSFMNRFFAIDPQLKKLAPVYSPKLVINIYKALAEYLQETILELKGLNDSFQKAENQKLAGQLGSVTKLGDIPGSGSLLSATALPASSSQLTKKQVRELREQLMVISEQRFIIESLIEDVKRQRKFDELITLEENKRELSAKIDELSEELGDFAF